MTLSTIITIKPKTITKVLIVELMAILFTQTI